NLNEFWTVLLLIVFARCQRNYCFAPFLYAHPMFNDFSAWIGVQLLTRSRPQAAGRVKDVGSDGFWLHNTKTDLNFEECCCSGSYSITCKNVANWQHLIYASLR